MRFSFSCPMPRTIKVETRSAHDESGCLYEANI